MEREGALVSPTSTDRGKSLRVWLAGVARLRDYGNTATCVVFSRVNQVL